MVAIIWTETANNDLIDIKEYISIHSALQATLFLEGILTKVQILKKYPEIGKRLIELPHAPYRELLYKSYRIIYRVEDDKIFIASVHHSARLLRNNPNFKDLF